MSPLERTLFSTWYFLTLLSFSSVFAQEPVVRFRQLNLEQGLSQSTVVRIAQDGKGYIWFGTLEGLNRFDGHHIKVFKHDPDDPFSIPSNTIRDLLLDRDGSLWVAFARGGVSRFNPTEETFTHFLPQSESGLPDSLPINDLEEDFEGNIWAGSSGILFKVNRESNELIPFKMSGSWSIFTIEAFANGQLMVGASRNLSAFDSNQLRFSDLEFDRSRIVASVFHDSQNRIWVGTTKGLYRYFLEEERFEPVSEISGSVSSITEDRNQNIWIGNRLNGIQIIQSDGSIRHIHRSTSNRDGLNDNRVVSLFQCSSGVMWVGTENGGVNYHFPTPFKHFRHEPGVENSIIANRVVGLYKDSQENLWVGTFNGLTRINRKTNRVDHFKNEEDNPNSLSGNRVRSIFEDSNGYIWLGTHGGGLNRFDPETQNFKHYIKNPRDPTSLGSDVIFTILEDRQGNLWVGTEMQLSRSVGDGFEHFRVYDNPQNSGSSYNIVDLHEDSAGNLWVGSYGGGLHLMDRITGRFQTHQVGGKISEQNNITTICNIEKNGSSTLWMGTYGGGLLAFDTETKSFKTWTTKDGLPNDVVYAVADDKLGNLWMSTNQGLVRFDPKKEVFQNYRLNDGIQSDEFMNSAYFKSPDGELFFGGIQGFNSFWPEDVVDNTEPPRVVLTDLQLFNKTVPLKRKNPESILEKVIDETQKLTLTHLDSMVSIEFSALHYADSNRNQYMFMLENHDADWIQASSENRRATYTALDPGDYTFRVKAASKEGYWGERESTLRINVKPPIWLTLWAKAIYLGLFLFGLFSFYRSLQQKLRRERQISEQQRQMAAQARLMAEKDRQIAEQAQASAVRLREFNRTLDQKVVERTRELADKNEELTAARDKVQRQAEKVQQQAEKLEIQAKELMEMNEFKTGFFTNISHELRTPLTLILGPIEDMANQDLNSKERTRLDIMKRNALRLRGLIDQLLDISKMEAGRLDLTLSNQDLVIFVRTRVVTFSSLAESRNLDLTFQCDHEELIVCFDGDQLDKVIYNLLSNAFKFTGENGKIQVNITLPSEDWVEVSVRDNGVGISKEQLPHVFDRFYQGRDSSTGFSASSGLGLALSRELIELHGGDISAESEEGFGSVFRIKLPMRVLEGAEADKSIGVQNASPLLESSEIQHDKEHDERELPVVILVEDNPDVRLYVQGHLEDAYRVITAENGQTGIDAVHKNKPDLVISDVMMPDMDGFEVCRQLKEDARFSHIPIMLLTAKNSSEAKTTGWRAGADAYLVKPFTVNELLALTANLIASRKDLSQRFNTRTVLNPGDIAATPADEAFLKQVLEVVEANYADADFGVHEFAEEMGLSRRQLLRKMSAITGSNLTDFLREFRLRRAAQLIEQKSGNISEIAYAVGYKNAAHFTARFRECFGAPPTEYSAKNVTT